MPNIAGHAVTGTRAVVPGKAKMPITVAMDSKPCGMGVPKLSEKTAYAGLQVTRNPSIPEYRSLLSHYYSVRH